LLNLVDSELQTIELLRQTKPDKSQLITSRATLVAGRVKEYKK
jgi:hypothetical protein